MARATSSLPVPLSPRTSTVTSVSATRPISSCTSRIFSPLVSSAACGRRDDAELCGTKGSELGMCSIARNSRVIRLAPPARPSQLSGQCTDGTLSKANATRENFWSPWRKCQRFDHNSRGCQTRTPSDVGSGVPTVRCLRRISGKRGRQVSAKGRPGRRLRTVDVDQARLIPHSLILLRSVL